MTRTAAVALALVGALAAAAARADEGVAVATLENGTSVGFALVRTGSPGAAEAIGEAALQRSNSVSRVLFDRESGSYFGYRVEVEKREGPRPFRVAFRPLDRGAVERELKQRGECPGCPAPAPLGSGPQFPPALLLAEGEALTLELLTNPANGERILDVLKVSARSLAGDAMRQLAARTLESQTVLKRATIMFARGEYAAAAELYRQVLELQPHDATLNNQIGMCYQHLENDAQARRYYDRALELNPRYAAVWNNVGTLEQSRKRFKAAVRAYRKAIELKPSLATAWKNLGNVYLALGQLQEAFESYQESYRIDPTILESQAPGVPSAGVDAATQNFYLAKLLAANGHKDAALEFLKRAKEAGFRDFAKLEADGDFKQLIADPRYKELLAR